jgi:recombination associated protein RdgC
MALSNPIELTLTEWLKDGDLPAGFSLGDSATLKAVLEDGGVLKSKKQDLVSDEIRNHLDAGKLVTELALNWNERVDFTLTDAAAIKRIRFSDVLTEQNSDIDREDMAQRADADFLLMTGELSALISNLVVALGGEAQR